MLSDQDKRSNYDRFGLDAVKGGANMPPGFGGGGGAGSLVYKTNVPLGSTVTAPLAIPITVGYGGTGGNFFEFEALAEEYGFMICSPTGLVDNFGISHWNSNFSSNMTTVDDIGFLSS